MAMQKINIDKFLELRNQYPVIDVRSPGEFSHAHIPGAYTLPLFTDEERKIVGTAYKQQGRQPAIKIGLDIFGGKMTGLIDIVEDILKQHSASSELPATLLVYCWRGGMRSAGIAWLLDLYGYKVYTLVGGYKAFRRWTLDRFEKQYEFKILGGYTGSGKTLVIEEFEKQGQAVIDLEKLAHHKGSAFGALGEEPQPSQEMFENKLALELSKKPSCWLEDESQRIGKMIIPNAIWKIMRSSPVFFLDIPFEARLDYITTEYGIFDKEKLSDAIKRIERRLGGLEAKNALNFLAENEVKECFRILLAYYDKLYKKGLYNRNNPESLLNMIPCNTVGVAENLARLLVGEPDHQNTA